MDKKISWEYVCWGQVVGGVVVVGLTIDPNSLILIIHMIFFLPRLIDVMHRGSIPVDMM